MPLPTIVTPSYELTLPSNRKKIKYRPFLVKEETVSYTHLRAHETPEHGVWRLLV